MAARGMTTGLGLSPAGSPCMGGGSKKFGGSKKTDDGALPSGAGGGYDPESAMLQGASTTFQPLAGLLRGRGGAPMAVLAVPAGLLDKLTVAMYRRPVARAALAMYFIVVHVMALLF
jgi:hypothetical protein